MKIKRHEGHEREIPHAHIYHALLPIIFMAFWILDSQFFQISTILNHYISLFIRLPLSIGNLTNLCRFYSFLNFIDFSCSLLYIISGI